MKTMISQITNRALDVTRSLDGVGPLLARITVGVVFAGTGWGKLHSLDKVAAFFTDLGIPAPYFQATLVGSVEFFGGILLVLGLFARLVSIPMMTTMVVALLTAKRAEIHGFADLLGAEEWLYLVMFTWIILAGPGRLSLDHLLVKRSKLAASFSASSSADCVS